MRFGWSGWRRWPPWLVGYAGILLIAAAAMVLFMGLGSCASALGADRADPMALAWALGTLVLGGLMMAVGVRLIRTQLSDESD
jgi:hypothetical protein